jgi:hypothetical protein
MVVFVLLGLEDYEGEKLLGVYASVEEAEAARDVIAKRMSWDGFAIERRTLGDPARVDWED